MQCFQNVTSYEIEVICICIPFKERLRLLSLRTFVKLMLFLKGNCYNFPFLVARGLKFGSEKIYLVPNKTKKSLIRFYFHIHRQINIFVEHLCCPVSGQQAQYPTTAKTM